METILDIQIRRKEALSPAENAACDTIDRVSFHDAPPGISVWSQADWMITGCTTGQIVAMTAIVERTARVDGRPVRLGGIGSVATLPERRRRGYAQAILERAANFMRTELRVDFGLLVCSAEMLPYYTRLGWQRVTEPVLFDQPTGKMTWPEETMILPGRERDWPRGEVDLCGLPW